jgi:hypothetical protein
VAAGSALVLLSGPPWAAWVVPRVDEPPSEVGLRVLDTYNSRRIPGQDGQTVAFLARLALFARSGVASGAVLVDGSDWQAAAAASPLIGRFGAALLMTHRGSLSRLSQAGLQAMSLTGSQWQGTDVVLVGARAAPAADEIRRLGMETEVIAGVSAVELAAAVDGFASRYAPSPSNNVMLVSDADWSAALPAAYYSAHSGTSLLFVRQDNVPKATAAVLGRRRPPVQMYVIGDPVAVTDEVLAELRSFGHVKRIAGRGAADTAVQFARYSDSVSQFGWGLASKAGDHQIVLASQAEPQLATAGLSLGKALNGAALLFADRATLPSATRRFLASLGQQNGGMTDNDATVTAWLVGGRQHIGYAAQADLSRLLDDQAVGPSVQGLSVLEFFARVWWLLVVIALAISLRVRARDRMPGHWSERWSWPLAAALTGPLALVLMRRELMRPARGPDVALAGAGMQSAMLVGWLVVPATALLSLLAWRGLPVLLLDGPAWAPTPMPLMVVASASVLAAGALLWIGPLSLVQSTRQQPYLAALRHLWPKAVGCLLVAVLGLYLSYVAVASGSAVPDVYDMEWWVAADLAGILGLVLGLGAFSVRAAVATTRAGRIRMKR